MCPRGHPHEEPYKIPSSNSPKFMMAKNCLEPLNITFKVGFLIRFYVIKVTIPGTCVIGNAVIIGKP